MLIRSLLSLLALCAAYVIQAMELPKTTEEIITLTIPTENSWKYGAYKHLVETSKALQSYFVNFKSEFKPGTEISLPIITPQQLEHLLALAKDNALENDKTIAKYLGQLSVENVISLLNAADYLELETLYDEVILYITNYILTHAKDLGTNTIDKFTSLIPESFQYDIKQKLITLIADFDFKEHANLTGHTGNINSIAFSPNGTMLASASADKTVKLWNIQTGELIATLTGHTGTVFAVAFSSDGNLLASGSGDKTIKIWNVKTGKLIDTLAEHTSTVFAVAFSPHGTMLASASFGIIKIWDIKTQKTIATFSTNASRINSIAFSPDGTMIASGSHDSTIRLWNIETKEEIGTLTNSIGAVYSVAFSPNGRMLASGSEDKAITLWDISTKQILATFWGHKSSVSSVAFSPNSGMFASASWDTTIKIWVSEKKSLEPLSLDQLIIFFIARELGIDSLSKENKEIFNSLPDFAKAPIEKKKETSKEEKK